MLASGVGIHFAQAMEVAKGDPLRAVTFTGIDLGADRQTGVAALL